MDTITCGTGGNPGPVNPSLVESISRDPAREEGGIPLHQEDPQAGDGLPPCLPLILAQVSCQG